MKNAGRRNDLMPLPAADLQIDINKVGFSPILLVTRPGRDALHTRIHDGGGSAASSAMPWAILPISHWLEQGDYHHLAVAAAFTGACRRPH